MGIEDDWCGPGQSFEIKADNYVDFSLCFEGTVIVAGPYAFLLIAGLLRSIRLALVPGQGGPLSNNLLYVLKLFFSGALMVCTFIESIYVADQYTKDGRMPKYQLFMSAMSALGATTGLLLAFYEHYSHRRSSAVLSFSWSMLLAMVVIRARSLVIRWETEFTDTTLFTLFWFYFVIIVVLFFLGCFSEPRSMYDDIGAQVPCPEESAALWSYLSFTWLDPLMYLGYKKPLQKDDLFDLTAGESCHELGASFDHSWEKEIATGKPFLGRALFKSFGTTFVVAGVFKILQDTLNFVSPILLKDMITFTENQAAPDWQGYGYSFLLFLTAMVQSFLLHQYFHRCFRTGMRLRSAIISAVYRKALRLSNTSRQSSTVGEIVNLMSVDAQRFQDVTSYMHTLWSAPYQIALCLYFLYDSMGVSILSGLGVMLLMIPINMYIAVRTRAVQKRQMVAKDKRIKLMSEILNGMKVIKLYGWEIPFMGHVGKVRDEELGVIKDAAYLNAGSAFIWTCSPFLVSLATFMTYSLSGNDLDATKAFVALSLFNVLQFPLSMLPMMISSVVEMWVSHGRLERFLLLPELKTDAVERGRDNYHNLANSGSALIRVNQGSFKWTEDGQTVLDSVNLSVDPGSLTAVVGTVGSGKSSLISSLLGDMERVGGSVELRGSVAYVPQQAWIQNATLRNNILFGKAYDQTRYERTLKACALEQDIEILPNGDMTEIGEKGINLSGGQKQRVSLARAVYSDADVYILDDPLSAVDAHVGRHIFDNVIGPNSLLRNKVRLLVTHGIGFLSQTNCVVVLKQGRVSEVGHYQNLLNQNGEFSKFIAEFGTKASKGGEEGENEEGESVAPLVDIASNAPGSTSGKTLGRQTSQTPSEGKGNTKVAAPVAAPAAAGPKKGELIADEKSETGAVRLQVLKDYMKAVGYVMSVVVLIGYLIGQAASIGSSLWLAQWTADATDDPDAVQSDIGYYLGIYAVLGIGMGLMVLLVTFVQAFASIIGSRSLHNSMLVTVMRSPMAFFDTTPVGRVLNRFSKDIYGIDETIPRAIRSFLMTFFRVVSVIIVISYSTPPFLAAVVPLFIVYVFVQRYYVSTARQLQRLDSVTRSPIYAQFGESITGASTIRAYERVGEFVAENERIVDLNQKAYYPNIAANRWLAVRLELVGNMIILLAGIFAVVEKANGIDPGLVGLSISYALNVTQALNWMVRMSSDLETNIVAVERVKEYTELAVEAPPVIEENRPSEDWPTQGRIEMINYSVKYRPELDLVLRKVNLTVQPGERIGVCGRTGAGKSSLTLCLFRIIEAVEGSIIIDGLDISQIGLDDLRSRLTIIPQDPVLFSGTVRDNLDPFNYYADLDLRQALDRAHLGAFINSLPLGLNAVVSEGGENFSVGQRQLICLARALLRRTRILILDEATAAVDLETDDLIQQTIRREFAKCTIITIAHRINTIMDSTRILVLDNGRVAELDTPEALLNNRGSIFHSICVEAGLAQ